MDGTKIKQYEYDYTDQFSFHNYVERLDLACASPQTMGLLGSAFFAGWTTAAIIVPRFADLYGRKLIWGAAMLVQAPTIFGLINSNSVLLTQALLFVMGLCAAGRTSVGFLYLMELVPANARAMVALLLGTMDCMTMIYATIYFKFITHDSIYWELFSAF